MNECQNKYLTVQELNERLIVFSTKTNDWQGYAWLSGNSEVEEINGDLTAFSNLSVNGNFIYELNIYSEKFDISVSIRQLDDKWLLMEIENPSAKFAKSPELFRKLSLMSKIKEKKMKFIEAWLPERDALCGNLEVLRPTWIAFVGFENN
jgi:CRISPR type III-associated protein (TIGR04423 family)